MRRVLRPGGRLMIIDGFRDNAIGWVVLDIITAGGHTHPPVKQRVFWALTEGAVAAVLLVTGGLTALQTAAIITALPFTVVMLFACYGLVKGLRQERRSNGTSSADGNVIQDEVFKTSPHDKQPYS